MVRYGAVDPLTATVRVNGFSPPMTQNQMLFIVGNTSSFIAFYIVVSIFIFSDSEHPISEEAHLFKLLICLHASLAVIGFLSWIFVETHDPSLPSCFGALLPDTGKWTVARYVSEHRKPIEGLDHFCGWLNVAIARSNYIPFFILTICGVFQYALQGVIGTMVLTLWHADLIREVASPEDPDALIISVLICIVTLTSFGMAFPYTMLLIFHCTLLSQGETTYTYVQNAQKAELKLRRERTALAASTKSQTSSSSSLSSSSSTTTTTTAVPKSSEMTSLHHVEAGINAGELELLREDDSPPPGQLIVDASPDQWNA